jgi:hypothetical protein
MKPFLALAAALFLFSCSNTADTPQIAPIASTTKPNNNDAAAAKEKIAKLHEVLEKTGFDHSGDIEKIQAVNKDLYSAWEEIASKNLWRDATINPNDPEKTTSTYLLSPDKKLALITWNSQIGGTMLDIEGIAIFETAQGVKTAKLFNKKNQDGELGIMYRDLYTLTNKSGETIYYAYGASQLSSRMPIYVVDGFRIADQLVKNVPIAKGEAQGIGNVYDLAEVKNIEINGLAFSADKKQITVPAVDKNNVPTGKNSIYVFDGDLYVKQ